MVGARGEALAKRRVAAGAVWHRDVRAIPQARVPHPQGLEDPPAQKISERLPGGLLEDEREHLVPDVAVLEALARREDRVPLPRQVGERVVVGDKAARAAGPRQRVVVIRQSRRVGQQVAYRHRLAEPGEIRQEAGDRSVVVETVLLAQDHRQHGGELLRDGSDVERRPWADRDPSLDVGEAQAGGVDDSAVPDHHHRHSRGAVASQRGKERVEALAEVPGARHEQERCRQGRQAGRPRREARSRGSLPLGIDRDAPAPLRTPALIVAWFRHRIDLGSTGWRKSGPCPNQSRRGDRIVLLQGLRPIVVDLALERPQHLGRPLEMPPDPDDSEPRPPTARNIDPPGAKFKRRPSPGGTMRVIAFILAPAVIRKIRQDRPRPEPRAQSPPPG